MSKSSSTGAPRRLTERQVLEELGLDRMELYLAATAEKLGRYDSVSHVLIFFDEEVEALAARLGIARRKRSEPAADLAQVPEPNSE